MSPIMLLEPSVLEPCLYTMSDGSAASRCRCPFQHRQGLLTTTQVVGLCKVVYGDGDPASKERGTDSHQTNCLYSLFRLHPWPTPRVRRSTGIPLYCTYSHTHRLSLLANCSVYSYWILIPITIVMVRTNSISLLLALEY